MTHKKLTMHLQRTIFTAILLLFFSSSLAQNATGDIVKNAELGDPEAQYVLGKMYLKGDGMKANASEALDWFLKSAKQGYAAAQNRVGMIYYDGAAEIPKDRAGAFPWFEKAAQQGHRVAQFYYGYQLFSGEVVLENRDLGLEWMLKAAANNCRRAKIRLARIYDNGEGLEVDKEKAFYWYTEAAKHNITVAQIALGRMYSNGEGVEKDINKAIEWYTHAVDQNKRTKYRAMKGLIDVYTKLGNEDKVAYWQARLKEK
ncbi:hypothetical protein BOW13_07445 [Solemya velum gill symbiont]|nr:hypothetical protein BOV89_07760 [Solemya velum gill symbiont]OOY51611.1 hypothetical protein BOV94_05020 [Solemya velum gill symbiont]OOY84672.1 hypothetical protein BOW13_07445 [Solemya velum gill symbiont]